ncbi:MAG: hypothetical protein FJZ88_08175 [Chloroflexi bacterium]|nr:hypothetical protein [Chloroflexota bacterium]
MVQRGQSTPSAARGGAPGRPNCRRPAACTAARRGKACSGCARKQSAQALRASAMSGEERPQIRHLAMVKMIGDWRLQIAEGSPAHVHCTPLRGEKQGWEGRGTRRRGDEGMGYEEMRDEGLGDEEKVGKKQGARSKTQVKNLGRREKVLTITYLKNICPSFQSFNLVLTKRGLGVIIQCRRCIP